MSENKDLESKREELRSFISQREYRDDYVFLNERFNHSFLSPEYIDDYVRRDQAKRFGMFVLDHIDKVNEGDVSRYSLDLYVMTRADVKKLIDMARGLGL